MLIEIGSEAFEVVLNEEVVQKCRIFPLHRDVPRQHHHQIEQDAGNPDGPAKCRPFTAQSEEEQDDSEREERSYWSLGERRGGAEEVEIEEPELLARFVPRVPTEHSNAERRGELHIGGSATGEADDSNAGCGDQRSIELASRAETPHVEEDHDDQQACAS